MTDHKGLPVAGYTDQSTERVQIVNANKREEERLLRRLEAIRDCEGVDGRWVSIAKTHIEQGFMALNRAIFKPERIKLPEDAE
jgi:hypothetical protein